MTKQKYSRLGKKYPEALRYYIEFVKFLSAQFDYKYEFKRREEITQKFINVNLEQRNKWIIAAIETNRLRLHEDSDQN